MNENITAAKLKKNISKMYFFLVPGAGTLELKSFHMRGHMTNDLVPGD